MEKQAAGWVSRRPNPEGKGRPGLPLPPLSAASRARGEEATTGVPAIGLLYFTPEPQRERVPRAGSGEHPTETPQALSAFSKTSLNIRKFMVHRLLKPSLENFEHYFTSV